MRTHGSVTAWSWRSSEAPGRIGLSALPVLRKPPSRHHATSRVPDLVTFAPGRAGRI